MKKLLLIFVVIALLSAETIAQDNFSLNLSQTYSRFRYFDSEGNIDENLKTDIRYSYGLNYNKEFLSGIFIRPEIGYKHFGATSILNNHVLDWSLQYVDINIGGGYIYDKYKFKPYAGASFYYAYLFKASQDIGDLHYNMLENDAIKIGDLGINVYAGVKYSFTSLASVFFELRNVTGLRQLEFNSEVNQTEKLYNRAFQLNFGIAFLINDNNNSRY